MAEQNNYIVRISNRLFRSFINIFIVIFDNFPENKLD